MFEVLKKPTYSISQGRQFLGLVQLRNRPQDSVIYIAIIIIKIVISNSKDLVALNSNKKFLLTISVFFFQLNFSSYDDIPMSLLLNVTVAPSFLCERHANFYYFLSVTLRLYLSTCPLRYKSNESPTLNRTLL